jgi:hypothetical protein
MRDISMVEPVAVTLRAGEWAWLLGYLAATGGESEVLDRLYAQIMKASD